MAKLTRPQINLLRRLGGDISSPSPRNRWAQEITARALIDRGLVRAEGWTLTPTGRAALATGKEESR